MPAEVVHMKITFSTLILLVFGVLVVLSGCSSDNNSVIVGTWEATKANINGETIQFTELETDNKDFRFIFNSNGSCKAIIAGVPNEGTYTFNETSVDILYGGKSEKLLYDEGVLTLNFYYNNEKTSYMFTKIE